MPLKQIKTYTFWETPEAEANINNSKTYTHTYIHTKEDSWIHSFDNKYADWHINTLTQARIESYQH